MARRSSQKARVFVVGSSNTDLVVSVHAIPKPGETVLGGDLRVFAGGKGANQAVAAARAGAETLFIGAFGADSYGRERRAELEAEGIDCSASTQKRAAPSGVALISVMPGDNAIVVAPGANNLLSPTDVRRGLSSLAAGDIVLCSLEVPLASVLAAAKQTKARRARLILNPAPLPRAGLPRELVSFAELVTPNETELLRWLGCAAGSPQARAKLRRMAPHAAFVVTRGARGVDVFVAGAYLKAAVVPPKVRAIDTVGAGDCFNGALAAALALGERELVAGLRFAVAASAISVTCRGAQASMPRRREILAAL